MNVRLAMWSAPRTISTALMRAWENRPDCRVVDEPLYAYYLHASGADHPGREEVIAAGETSWEAVLAELTAPVEGISYQKHMALHLLPTVPRDWIPSLTNVLLVREPSQMVASYLRSRAEVNPSDLGLAQQGEIFDLLDGTVPVIDSSDFLRDPEGYLRWLCEYVGVPFTDRMLRWPAGPRSSDGVWAPYWYGSVLTSTGFEPYRPRRVEVPERGRWVVEQIRPEYERLHRVRVRL